jgi:predicted PurR-regulated permease PerM
MNAPVKTPVNTKVNEAATPDIVHVTPTSEHATPDTSPTSSLKISVVILAVLAVIYTLYFAADFILPCLLAVVLNLLLQPPRRLLCERLHIPAPIVSLFLIVVLFGVVAAIGFAISLPASGWIAKAPQSVQTLQDRLGFLSGPITFVRHGIGQLEHLIQQGGEEAGSTEHAVQVQQPSNLGGVGLSILVGTRAAMGQIFTVVVLLFFLLTSGDGLLRNLVEVVPTFGNKRRVVEISMEIERNISGYLTTITIINFIVGVVNGLAMWLFGVPDPLLWGTLAFLLNYIPIIGPLCGVMIFFFVGLFSFSTLSKAFIPAGIYLLVHMIEGESITPTLLAKRFTLHPVLVIVSLFFWDWLWGIPGALLSLPILAIFKIVCDRIPGLTPIGHMLGVPEHGRHRDAGVSARAGVNTK